MRIKREFSQLSLFYFDYFAEKQKKFKKNRFYPFIFFS